MKQKKLLRMLSLLLIAVMLPLSAFAEIMWVDVGHGKNAVMRSGPSQEYAILTYVPSCGVVEVYDYSESDWYTYCEYNGNYGYIYTDYLVFYEPEYVEASVHTQPSTSSSSSSSSSASSSSSSSKNTTYGSFEQALYLAEVVPAKQGSYVNLRWAPSDSAEIQAKYYADTILLVIAQNKNWCQVIDLEDMRSGFMMRSFLTYFDEYLPDDDEEAEAAAPEAEPVSVPVITLDTTSAEGDG